VLQTQMHIFGVLWEVEIHFSVDRADPDTGLDRQIYIEEFWMLGYYPEVQVGGQYRKGDYIPCQIRSWYSALTRSQEAELLQIVEDHIDNLSREANV
jgi:hypothetical protein